MGMVKRYDERMMMCDFVWRLCDSYDVCRGVEFRFKNYFDVIVDTPRVCN